MREQRRIRRIRIRYIPFPLHAATRFLASAFDGQKIEVALRLRINPNKHHRKRNRGILPINIRLDDGTMRLDEQTE